MKRGLILGVVSLVLFIFCFNLANAANCGDTVTTSTTLSSHLVSCVNQSGLIINGSDITLDCAGYSISGNIGGGAQYGIYISSGAASSFSNITVKNCTISGFYEGVQVDGTLSRVNNTNIIYNTFFSNVFEAIYFSTASTSYGENISYNTILNNTKSDNTGILLSGVQSSTVQGNIIKNLVGVPQSSEGAIKILSGGGNLIADNFINNSNSSCILFMSSNTGNDVIKNNTISFCYMYGIYFENGISNSVNITENTITNITDLAFNAALRFADATTSNKLVWHNNIIAGPNAWKVYSGAMNLTVNGEGNYWGHTCPTLFNATIDASLANINDTNPYNESNGWLSHGPGCAAPALACGDTITTDTTLLGNLTCNGTALNVLTSNLIINCNGNTIEGNGSGVGIYFEGTENITLANCTIKSFNFGAFFNASSDSILTGNNFLNNTDTGIYFYLSDNNSVSGGEIAYSNILVNSGSGGIVFDIANGNNVTGIYMHNNKRQAIYLGSSKENLIDGNNIVSNCGGWAGISAYTAPNTTITNNNITNGTGDGLYLYQVTGLVLENNNISENSARGAAIYSSSDTLITGNDIINNVNDGLYLNGATATLYHNNLYGNGGYQAYSTNPIELSNGSEGNYWGHSCPYLFNATIDSNAADVNDSYPYNESDGWLSHGPGCAAAPSISCGDTINISTTLTSNLGPCNTTNGLNIAASDIVLDCNGSSISATVNSNYGVYVNGYNNITVQNCVINMFDNSMLFLSSNYNSIINNTVNSDVSGLELAGGGFSLISGNRVSDAVYGITLVSGSNNNTVINNVAINSSYGLDIQNSYYNELINNTVTSCDRGIHIYTSAGNLIQGNNVSDSVGSWQTGLFIHETSTGNTIKENYFTNNGLYGIYVYTADSTGNIIYHNNIYGNPANNIISALSPLEVSSGGEGNYWGHSCPTLFTAGTDSNDVNVNDSYPYNESDGWLSHGPGCGAPPVISSTAPINDSTINFEEVNYTLSKTVVSGTIVFSQYGGGPADPDSPHTCVLQGIALDAGIHSNLALATDANACVNWTSLLSGIYYQVTFDAADALGNNATTVTNTNILFEVIPPTNASLSINYLGGDIEVNTSQVFNVTVNVSCSGADCGEINVSLDPSVLTLDGGAADQYSSTDSESIMISTNSTDDIIVLLAAQETANDTSDEPVSVTSVSGANLTWHKRAAANITGDGYDQSNEIWWAYSPGILTSEFITVNFSGQIDDGVLHIFAVNGANTANPFDSNPSLPSIVNSGEIPQAAISTSNSNTVIFAMYGCPSYYPPVGPVPSDMTELYSTMNNGAHYWEYEFSEYKIVSSIQTGVNVGWINTSNDTFGTGNCSSQFILIADAIQSAVAGKGLISDIPGATPFWTNESNPRAITLNDSESQLVTFWVNASIVPAVPTNYTFFAYANLTSVVAAGAQTNNWVVTVYPSNDTTAPIITIDALSTTFNSAQLNWSTDEPSNSTLSIGPTLSLGMSNVSISNFSSGGYMGYSWGSDGFDASTLYYFNITSCDINNNCAVYSGNFTTLAVPSNPPGTTHHGGGGGILLNSYAMISSSATNNSLSTGSSYGYLLPGSSDSHKIIIVSINGKTVVLEFRSTPVRETFQEGETKQIDLNGDSVKEIEFTVTNVLTNSINFGIRSLGGETQVAWKENVTATPAAKKANATTPAAPSPARLFNLSSKIPQSRKKALQTSTGRLWQLQPLR